MTTRTEGSAKLRPSIAPPSFRDWESVKSGLGIVPLRNLRGKTSENDFLKSAKVLYESIKRDIPLDRFDRPTLENYAILANMLWKEEDFKEIINRPVSPVVPYYPGREALRFLNGDISREQLRTTLFSYDLVYWADFYNDYQLHVNGIIAVALAAFMLPEFSIIEKLHGLVERKDMSAADSMKGMLAFMLGEDEIAKEMLARVEKRFGPASKAEYPDSIWACMFLALIGGAWPRAKMDP
jgi:hypothetical protein